MSVDMAYVFAELKLTQNPDKTISLSTEKGKEGRVTTYDKGSNEGTQTEIKVLLPASECKIYKENGKIHADFRVDYDTKDLKKLVPLLPEGTHETLRSVIKTQKIE